jgi:hypothetical protein
VGLHAKVPIAILMYGVITECYMAALIGARRQGDFQMCRNIRTLHNFKPPATHDEIHASALQFVRKLSGFARPSKANEAVFNRAVEQVAHAAHELLDSLVTNAPPRDREVEAAKARARSVERFRARAG